MQSMYKLELELGKHTEPYERGFIEGAASALTCLCDFRVDDGGNSSPTKVSIVFRSETPEQFAKELIW